jgi:hypothetical protein
VHNFARNREVNPGAVLCYGRSWWSCEAGEADEADLVGHEHASNGLFPNITSPTRTSSKSASGANAIQSMQHAYAQSRPFDLPVSLIAPPPRPARRSSHVQVLPGLDHGQTPSTSIATRISIASTEATNRILSHCRVLSSPVLVRRSLFQKYASRSSHRPSGFPLTCFDIRPFACLLLEPHFCTRTTRSRFLAAGCGCENPTCLSSRYDAPCTFCLSTWSQPPQDWWAAFDFPLLALTTAGCLSGCRLFHRSKLCTCRFTLPIKVPSCCLTNQKDAPTSST